MRALVGLLIFVVFPICFVLCVGIYFSRKQSAFQKENPGKRYDIGELKKQMSPAAWRGWMALIAFLAFVMVVLRIYNAWKGAT